jgi:uncharacterized protein YbjT (DUF2867 family)
MAREQHWSQGITLVIGGTGKTGRRVADQLLKAGRQVRIGSRTTAARLLQLCTANCGDWHLGR